MNLWEWIPITDAAARLAVSQRLISRRVDSGRMDCLTVDGVRFVWLADVFHDIRKERRQIRVPPSGVRRRGFDDQQ